MNTIVVNQVVSMIEITQADAPNVAVSGVSGGSIVIASEGVQGPEGPQGDPGPQGPPGEGELPPDFVIDGGNF